MSLILTLWIIVTMTKIDKNQDVFELRIMARKELLKRKYAKNPFNIIRDKLLWIKTIDARFIRLDPKPIQLKLLDRIERLWHEGKPIRLWVLKARREGVSTLVEAIIFVLTIMNENMNSYIVSKDDDQCGFLFNITKLYYETLKKEFSDIVPEFDRNNAKEFSFPDTRSLIRIKTARDASAGRGDTYHLAHLSEIAFYPHAGVLMIGLQQAISDVANTMVVGETTANGLGGYFYDQWERAVQRKSDWIPMFFAWFDDPTYTRSFETEDERNELKKTLGTDLDYNDFDGEEAILQRSFKLSLEQLNWRRYMIRNKCDGSIDNFHQEYPSTPEEAFLVSGRPVFNVRMLARRLKVVQGPKRQGYLEFKEITGKSLNESRVSFSEAKNGYLRIYRMPEPGHNYVLGADAQKGKIQIESKGETDFSGMQIIDMRDLSVVATWEGRMDPDLFGLECMKVGMFYNNALVGIELNDGVASIARMKAEGYYNLYRKVTIDRVEEQPTNQLGWWTDAKSKLKMIGFLTKYIREGLGEIPDKQTLKQLTTYVYDDNGATNAQEGCHDDLVIPLAIALQLTLSYYDIINKEKDPKHTRGTMAYWKSVLNDDSNDSNRDTVI